MSARKGFTLVEILVAMTIFSIVMTSVYAAFNVGARVWRRGERTMQEFQDARVALAIMSKELRCAVPEAGHLFYGENRLSGKRDADRIEFFTVRPPLDPSKGYAPRILKVKYYIDPIRGGRGYVLRREERVVRSKIPPKKKGGTDKRKREKGIKMDRAWRCILTTNVNSLDFQYSWGRRWTQSCKRGYGLPAVVRVKLEFQGEERNAAPMRFETAMRIPMEPGEGPPKKKGKGENAQREKA